MRVCLAALSSLLVLSLAAAACSSDDGAGASFYAEARIEVGSARGDPLTRVGADTGTVSLVRFWFVPPDRWRREIEITRSALDVGTLIEVSDGEAVWTYDDRLGTYQRRDPAATDFVPSVTFSSAIGPLNAESVDVFIAGMRRVTDDDRVRRAGEAIVAGRRTEIVEFGPTSSASSDEARPSGALQTVTAEAWEARNDPGQLSRIFIDHEQMFMMRWAVDGGDDEESYTAEVTALDYDVKIDDELLTFEPPQDAREDAVALTTFCGGSRPGGSSSFGTHPGFLLPLHIPGGYAPTSTRREEGGADCEPVATWTLLEGDAGYVLLRQRRRADGLPAALRTGAPLDVGGHEGFRSASGSRERLAWADGDLVALLESDALPFEELLRIAASAERVAEASTATGGR
ncbi:MAG: hypothetical protein O2895_01760 [Chloroflexi bacterium]|nr:hypothetical protein [Chloroflexota bacterium]